MNATDHTSYHPAAAAPYGRPATDTLAIISLVAAFLLPLAGVICGHIALRQVRERGESGHGLALAAVIIGYVSIALTVVFFLALFLLLAIGSAQATA